jgi:D-tyrosyl-tRNA(Tyr) deacylase
MKIIIQRVNYASVTVDGAVTGKIDRGLLLLIGFGENDDNSKLKAVAEKITNMRIFPDEKGKFHFSVIDIKGGLLLVPQFTLFADCAKGRRPEFFGALAPDKATKLFDEFVAVMKSVSPLVETGIFGADMKVALENDGPVTIPLEY